MTKPERRQRRSDKELRRQRKQMERRWNSLQRRLQRQRDDNTTEERVARVDRVMAECQEKGSTVEHTRRRASTSKP